MRNSIFQPLSSLIFLLCALLFIAISCNKAADEEKEETSMSDSISEEQQTLAAEFNYEAPMPQDGVTKGVVELGASGFNSFIITIDDEKNWNLEKAEFGASDVYEGGTSESKIKRGLQNYIKKMLDQGVSGKDIHFVVSSSAAREDEVQTVTKVLKSIGYVVNEVTAEEEGQYALKATLPKIYNDNAFVVDVGSGNTKISWMEGSEIKSVETYGSKYYDNEVDGSTAYDGVFGKAEQVPNDKRNVCFIIGGAPYKMAKEVREDKERYTVLSTPEEYKTMLDGEKNIAGINIYKAIQDATGTNNFVFDWNSNFTIGFLLTL